MHGQNSLGPYPGPPPRRRRGRVIALVAGSAVVLVVVLALAVAHGIRAVQPSAAPTPAGRVHPTDGPTIAPSPTESDSPAVRPTIPTVAVPSCLECFPGLKITALVAKIKAKGWTCAPDGPGGTRCQKPNDQDLVKIHAALGRDRTLVGSVTLQAFSGGIGAYKQGEAQSIAKARADLPLVLTALFADAGVRAQLLAWSQTALPACTTRTKVNGYEADCSAPLAITINGKGNKKTITSWSVAVNFSGGVH